jgi:hypothetical protein
VTALGTVRAYIFSAIWHQWTFRLIRSRVSPPPATNHVSVHLHALAVSAFSGPLSCHLAPAPVSLSIGFTSIALGSAKAYLGSAKHRCLLMLHEGRRARPQPNAMDGCGNAASAVLSHATAMRTINTAPLARGALCLRQPAHTLPVHF